VRLGKWHRQLVIATLGLVSASGMLWFVLHDVMNRTPDNLLHWLLVAHGVSAYVLAVAFGSILPLHVVAGWHHRRHLRSGVAVIVTLALLIGQALLLYYGGEETHAWVRLAHIVTGFGALLAASIHVALGRRLRRHVDRMTARQVSMV
jgi:hypothetical protein